VGKKKGADHHMRTMLALTEAKERGGVWTQELSISVERVFLSKLLEQACVKKRRGLRPSIIAGREEGRLHGGYSLKVQRHP